MRLRKLLLILPLLFSFCALWPCAAGSWDVPRANYLTEAQKKLIVLPPPPAAGSKEEAADLAVVREWEKKRTDGQCEKARSEAGAYFEEFFGDISPFPTPLPADVSSALTRIMLETSDVSNVFKNLYKRPRPFISDAGLNPCLGKIPGFAYPSGHTALSRICAYVLSDLQPERRAEFMTRADEAALLRVIGGVHYPTDIAAGKRLSDALYPLLKKSPVFRKELKTLRGYLPKKKS
jgi:acid phosphatase (class A)